MFISIAIITPRNKVFSEPRKRIREDRRKAAKAKGGKGSQTKKKKEKSKKTEKEKEKAVKEIVPYKKSLKASKHLSEKASRENRLHVESRGRLLKLLKEKIDGKKIKRKRTAFTKSDLKLLRKLDALKNKLDSEDKEIKVQKEKLSRQRNELSELVNMIRKERIKITKLLEKKKQEDEKKVIRLLKILEGVKPVHLAAILENIDQDLFIILVRMMKPKIFAKALKYMSKDKAVKLNEKLLAKER